ncbi:Glutathione S-transferase [hydrothermal vent metagenome]|uniref:Glutathione S-transferase n=1 Tax=hydrothermal vent metagenome TaxID=652676 RepID=A0A3B0W7Q3_9ZZZZ
MQIMKLIIANKRYSSWSMRPWLILKVKGIEFEEQLSAFDLATNHSHFWDFSPTKKVPVLKHGKETVWDSLAIMEYLADLFPEKQLWPDDMIIRAHARSIANEMHSGFMALRNECPMNMCRTPSTIELSVDAVADIKRIEIIWADCLNQYGGPYLFGEFSIADAMFAPVVNRLKIYQIPISDCTKNYCAVISELSAWQEWDRAAHDEPWVCENVEI